MIQCNTHNKFLFLFQFRSRRSSNNAPLPRLNPNDESYIRLAADTAEELDWCLDQLETIQTHRSVSDMASLKVRFYTLLLSKKNHGINDFRISLEKIYKELLMVTDMSLFWLDSIYDYNNGNIVITNCGIFGERVLLLR